RPFLVLFFFFFNPPVPTETYTLSLHDALPIYNVRRTIWRYRRAACHGPARPVVANAASPRATRCFQQRGGAAGCTHEQRPASYRSEEHTSELQSPYDLVCRLLLEKKKKT